MSYTPEMLAQYFECTERTLRPGDVMYIPRGVPHFAHTDKDHVAMHATLGLAHAGASVADLVDTTCAALSLPASLVPSCKEWRKLRGQGPLQSSDAETLPLIALAADIRAASDSPLAQTQADVVVAHVRGLSKLLKAPFHRRSWDAEQVSQNSLDGLLRNAVEGGKVRTGCDRGAGDVGCRHNNITQTFAFRYTEQLSRTRRDSSPWTVPYPGNGG
jgi:hypothetical protein